MRYLINSVVACFLCYGIVLAFRKAGIETEAFDFIGRLATAIVLVGVVDYMNGKPSMNKGG